MAGGSWVSDITTMKQTNCDKDKMQERIQYYFDNIIHLPCPDFRIENCSADVDSHCECSNCEKSAKESMADAKKTYKGLEYWKWKQELEDKPMQEEQKSGQEPIKDWEQEFDDRWASCNCEDGWDMGQCSIGSDEKSAEFYKDKDMNWWDGISRVDPQMVKSFIKANFISKKELERVVIEDVPHQYQDRLLKLLKQK